TRPTRDVALAKHLSAYLEGCLPQPRPEGRPPLSAPAPQSRRPQAAADAVVLHLTARNLVQKGGELVPERLELGRSENYHNHGVPAENWIVLERGQWTKFLGSGAIHVGSSWTIDPQFAAQLFLHLYPPTEDNDVTRNRIDAGTLRATVVAVDGGVIRA